MTEAALLYLIMIVVAFLAFVGALMWGMLITGTETRETQHAEPPRADRAH